MDRPGLLEIQSISSNGASSSSITESMVGGEALGTCASSSSITFSTTISVGLDGCGTDIGGGQSLIHDSIISGAASKYHSGEGYGRCYRGVSGGWRHRRHPRDVTWDGSFCCCQQG